MINILYLLKCLETNKVSELVANIDAPLLDINLAIWDAETAGQIEVDYEKDRIKVLTEAGPTDNPELADKIMRAVRYYVSKEMNLTVGKLTTWIKNQGSDHNYLYHDYICTLQSLIDSGQLLEEIVSVPKTGKRPYHKFVFLCLPGNPNEEWNAREINKWIERFGKNKVK
jgi:hypothetical protein